MSYNFDASQQKLKEEITEEQAYKENEDRLKINEGFTYLSNAEPFMKSVILATLCFFFTFHIIHMPTFYAKLGFGLYLAYPTLCIIIQIIFTKTIKYRLHNGELYIDNKLLDLEKVKSIAITEYSPCYMKNDHFRLPAINFSGYKEFMVEIIPSNKKENSIFLFLCTQNSAQKLLEFIHKHSIKYGYVEIEPRKIFFYY